MTLLARLIAQEEGFFRPGTIPARRHNPGDLRHSPHSMHPGNPDDIGTIGNDAEGWLDLERQLSIDAARGWTLEKTIYTWAPAGDGANNPSKYLADILRGFDGAGYSWVAPQSALRSVLAVQA